MILPAVNKKIEKLYLDGALCQRAISIEMAPLGDRLEIVAWQCNMAGMKTTDLKLPTVLRFLLDGQGVVLEAELMENFKGSQGLPCSQPYLNRILKSRLVGMSFAADDTVLRHETILHCRHLFELTAAAITFYRYCRSNLDQKNTLSDLTRAYPTDAGIQIKDDYHINDTSLTLEQQLLFSPSELSLQATGEICYVKHMTLNTTIHSQSEAPVSICNEISDVSGNTNIVMSMMKLFSYPWQALGRKLGVRRNYYFTNLVPSSVYGVLVQAIALMIFPDNYNYFQHALAGLQRSQDRPLCVGMALNQAELREFYPEFREEDLFG